MIHYIYRETWERTELREIYRDSKKENLSSIVLFLLLVVLSVFLEVGNWFFSNAVTYVDVFRQHLVR